MLQVGRLTAEAEAARAREARLRVDCDTLVARHHSALGELERVMAARTLARTAAHSAVDQVSRAQLAGGEECCYTIVCSDRSALAGGEECYKRWRVERSAAIL